MFPVLCCSKWGSFCSGCTDKWCSVDSDMDCICINGWKETRGINFNNVLFNLVYYSCGYFSMQYKTLMSNKYIYMSPKLNVYLNSEQPRFKSSVVTWWVVTILDGSDLDLKTHAVPGDTVLPRVLALVWLPQTCLGSRTSSSTCLFFLKSPSLTLSLPKATVPHYVHWFPFPLKPAVGGTQTFCSVSLHFLIWNHKCLPYWAFLLISSQNRELK